MPALIPIADADRTQRDEILQNYLITLAQVSFDCNLTTNLICFHFSQNQEFPWLSLRKHFLSYASQFGTFAHKIADFQV
jgi:hypothetical protein